MTATDTSAIIATHNGRSRGYLSSAIESVLRQTKPPVEIVVVDDASTDDTATFVSERFGQDVQLVRLSENAGPSAARNHGVRATRSTWVAFLDDDDEWLPTKLEQQTDHASRHAARIVFGRAQIIDATGSPTRQQWLDVPKAAEWPAILFLNPVHGPGSVLVQREALLSVGAFPLGIHMGEDWVLWARLARSGAWAFHDDVVVRYRKHEHQAAAGRSWIWVRERTVDALRELVSDLSPGRATLVLRSYAYGATLRALAEGRLTAAWRLARVASAELEWRLLAEKAAVAGLARMAPSLAPAVTRWELDRMVRRFERLG